MPLPAWLELEGHAQTNSVQVADGMKLTLTDFQRDLWRVLRDGQSAAVSAPTSAGKSYALGRYLVTSLAPGSGRWGVYVVPTRALVNEVSSDLLDTAAAIHAAVLPVVTVPVAPVELGIDAGIYVVTQERLQILLEAAPKLRFDLAVIDEAHLISEPSRGVILQTVIEEMLARAPNMQLLFGSPHTKNPAVFGRVFQRADVVALAPPERPVAQHLLFLDTDAVRTDEVSVSTELRGVRESLGIRKLPLQLLGEEQTLAAITYFFGGGNKSLVYASGKAGCEKLAGMLRQLTQTYGKPATLELQKARDEFADFVQAHVHAQYPLADAVRAGVGFHYGNMPAIIRRTVEDYFDESKLDVLVCTSTLLHGVNLPAKNLFLYNPTKGREWGSAEDEPVSALDFWNLAGRAGRMGREFAGHVHLIDYARWKGKPLNGDRDEIVTPSFESTLKTKTDQLLEFIQDRDHPSGKHQGAEGAFVKLVNAARQGGLAAALDRVFPDLEAQPVRNRIASAVTKVAVAMTVPVEITHKHITVSVFRQQEMFEYLLDGISTNGPERYMPVHPLRQWDEAHQGLIAIIKRIHNYFEKKRRDDKSHTYFAPFALRWMRGTPLPEMIDGAIKFREKKAKRGFNVPTVIRDVLEDIENELRFRLVKYTACYTDLLAAAFQRTGHASLVERIPALPLFLELGAASKTMVNLVGLGLSRTTASVVAQRSVNQDMTRVEAKKWLAAEPWDRVGLSPIFVREIERVKVSA
ncbi:DEAD/DEAH box helicase [Anaeromyxobacter paludicola]|uniref:DEAD/DEAH box helicase n=2 Tax=Anaeromyxobacter paludicola TaxID=2918171 RepID=A0ABM7X9T9_9BACT|nr:DEAD/DEAH box helicase [Anaeromyxobacter paludicola]